MLSNLYWYKGALIRVIDGDSLEVILDRGFHDRSVKKIRLARIDCPETRGEERNLGLEAKECVENLLRKNSELTINSTKLDSFGRAIAEVYFLEQENWINLSDRLVTMGQAEYKKY